MASQTEVMAPGEFIYSEANGTQSRENVTVVAGAGVLPAGRMLGKVTASGKYTNYDDGLATGVETAAGILYAECDASGAADVPAVIIARNAEVVSARVTSATAGHKAAGITDLQAVGIRFR